MTNLITEARELCEKATSGPWGSRIDVGKKYYVFTHGYGVRDFCCLSGGFEHESDAAFVARSRTLVPELCDALEKAQAQNKQLMHELCKLACESVGREKTLARLEAEVIEACNSVRWVPVTEQLPTERGYYLAVIKRIAPDELGGNLTNVKIMRWLGEDWRYPLHIPEWINETITETVTHWMPLPEPPGEE